MQAVRLPFRSSGFVECVPRKMTKSRGDLACSHWCLFYLQIWLRTLMKAVLLPSFASDENRWICKITLNLRYIPLVLPTHNRRDRVLSWRWNYGFRLGSFSTKLNEFRPGLKAISGRMSGTIAQYQRRREKKSWEKKLRLKVGFFIPKRNFKKSFLARPVTS